MKYVANGKAIQIPDDEIKNIMTALKVSQEEAIDTWLCDNDLEENEEQEELDSKAKKVKIKHDAHVLKTKTEKRNRTVKISDEKKDLFTTIKNFLFERYGEDVVTVVTDNKLVTIHLGEKTFKLDLVEQRQKKKE